MHAAVSCKAPYLHKIFLSGKRRILRAFLRTRKPAAAEEVGGFRAGHVGFHDGPQDRAAA